MGDYIGVIIIGIINLAIICWIITKINSFEICLKSIAKNLEILTQNQKTFFEDKLRGRELDDPKHIEDDEKIDKDEILNKMRNKF